MIGTAETHDFEHLLDYLKRSRGFDFTGYKRSSLTRRIQRRMQTVGIAGVGDYTDYLEVHPEEFSQLFNTILINVTTFFRDAPAWDYLASDLIPLILSQRKSSDPIRIWSAGCASGEEAYSLAIAFAEAIGFDALRERVKIYATDVDEDALARARQAIYSERVLQMLDPGLREKYFDLSGARYAFRKDLRRCLIFGRHDLIQDAPISRIDLLSCRNCLMYFNAETQAKILARFQFALNEGAFLFLGRAETLLTHANSFIPTDPKRRVFMKVPRVTLRGRMLATTQPSDDPPNLLTAARSRDAAFDAGLIAQVVVDVNGMVAQINGRARALFGLSTADVGRPLQDLDLSYRPVELRSMIDRASAERGPVTQKDVEWPATGAEIRSIDAHVTPLFDTDGTALGVSVTFVDVSDQKHLRMEVERSRQELETAYEELQSTVEELETTNEELQSTVEELETTNEELQATNEELETMNEELQATNEELETMNEELRGRGDELHRVNAFLESILASLRGGVAVTDGDLRVTVWNDRAEDLWGMRSDEILGKHFLNLDIGLPVEQLRPAIRAILTGESVHQEVLLAATNRRGKPIACKVTCTPLSGDGQGVNGSILLMEETPTA